jgi:hypothetical protein
MHTQQPDEAAYSLLGALAHLYQEKEQQSNQVHGLAQLQEWILRRWTINYTTRDLLISRKWLVKNELIKEHTLGYTITELGLEYIRHKVPELAPSEPLYEENKVLELKIRVPCSQTGTKAAKRRRTRLIIS